MRNSIVTARNTAITASIALLIGAAGVTLAQGSHAKGPQPVSISAMRQKIEALAYNVRRIKVDDGVFKAQIVERQSGGAVEAIFDLSTGELIRAKLQ